MSFDRDTALNRRDDGSFEGLIRESWWTARGPLGGYVMPDPVLAPPAGLPGAKRPPFLDWMVFQPRFGAVAFTSAEHSEVGGWTAINEQRELDALTLVVRQLALLIGARR